LTAPEMKRRAFLLLTLPLVLFALKSIPPNSFPHWFPFPTSCGAITGLPCIFCGTTRAVHYLLNANFSRALYYNWLAFPLIAAVFALLLVYAAELSLKRRLIARWRGIRPTRAKLGGAMVGLLLLWVLQVYLAVSQHKTELLNPNGPLYSLVVR
jgi:hypothetical protein